MISSVYYANNKSVSSKSVCLTTHMHAHMHAQDAVQECLLLCSETGTVKLYKYKNMVGPHHNALQFMFDRPTLQIIKYFKNIFL